VQRFARFRIARLTLGLSVGWIAACVGASLPPWVDVGEAREARQLAERWIEQIQGFDGLEAYELRIDERSLGFAVARQHRAGEVRVLAYVARPRHLDEVALLVRRRTGAPLEVLSYVTSQLYGSGLGARQPGTVMRVPSLSQGMRLGAAAAVAMELVSPFPSSDYRFERLPDADVAGEPCTRLRAIPRAADPEQRELRIAVSKRSGVALEQIALDAQGRELHRIEVSAQDLRQVGERWLPGIQRVQSADGTRAELRLVNVLEDVDLPESLFTSRALQLQRFPSF
jgi:hypothetical protein